MPNPNIIWYYQSTDNRLRPLVSRGRYIPECDLTVDWLSDKIRAYHNTYIFFIGPITESEPVDVVNIDEFMRDQYLR